MRRRRRRSFGLLDLVYLAMVLGLFVGASLWLDRRGVVVNARVEGKKERIVVLHEPSGDWDRYYDIAAGFRGADGSHWQASVTVPRERYDALHAGDAIEVRYLAELPFLARTTDRSTASVAWELAQKIAAVPLFVWLGAGLVALWIAARVGTITSAVVGAVWTYSAFPLLFSTPSPAQPAGADGVARVAGITSISRAPSMEPRSHRSAGGRSAALRRLKVPYQVVQLAVPSNGGRDTVLAVDAVDSGSVAGLAFGTLLPVRFDPSAPRQARLAGATRRFVDANRYHMIVPVVGLGILGTLGAANYGWRRRRRQAVRADGLRLEPSAAHLVAPLLWLTLGGTTLVSACHVERTVRRRNWPAASAGQGAAGQDTAALAAFAPTPSHPCAWMPPAEVAALAGVVMTGPLRPHDAGCFYPVRGDSGGVAITVRLLASPATVRSAGWNEDVTHLSPAAFAGRSGSVHIEVVDVGGVLSFEQVRAIAQRVLDRNRVAAVAPSAQPSHPDTAGTPGPATDTLLVGCSGGIRGEGSGMAVTGDGDLLEWSLQGWPGHGHPYRPVRRDSAAAVAVFAAVPGASGPDYNPMPDEISCFYSLHAGVRFRSIAWPAGEPPAEVLALLDALARVTGADRHSQWLQRQSRRIP